MISGGCFRGRVRGAPFNATLCHCSYLPARDRGAGRAGLSTESLFASLSADRAPDFATVVLKVVEAFGVRPEAKSRPVSEAA